MSESAVIPQSSKPVVDGSWRIGRGGGFPDRLYDALRRSLNHRLVEMMRLDPSAILQARCNRPDNEPTLRTLEAGCGTASASSLLARDAAAMAVCVDLDEEPLRIAQARDAKLFAVVADIRRLPFLENCLDFVFSSSTVEHLSEPGVAVAEMARVCRPGGTVFVGVPYLFGPLWFQPFIHATRLGRWLGPVFTESRLRNLAHCVGLQPVRSLRYFWRFFIGVVARKPSQCAKDGSP